MSVRKKVRLGQINVDRDQFALIVNYTTEVHQLDDLGNPVSSETQLGQKTIRVPRGLQGSEIPARAQEICEKCKYIHASKVGEVERLLYTLMEHEAMDARRDAGAGPPAHHHHQERSDRGDRDRGDRGSRSMGGPPPGPPRRQEPLLPAADVRQIEEYADQLYEDNMDLKVHGAKCILRVCTEPINLEILAEHDTMLGVLSRELRENSKKSSELSITIVGAFLTFSHFSQFHGSLMQHQCGDVTMRVVEYESRRHQVRKEDIERRMKQHQELGSNASGEDKRLFAKEEKKYRQQLNKQNKLMLVCLMCLLNLAEEISIERKMVNRKMPQLLAQLLDRNHDELILVALQFLKKLSVFEENKERVSTPETLSRLVALAQHSNVRVALCALRVLYNLSFDEPVRASLVESGIVKLLVDLLRNPPFRHIVLRLLYHFSMDDRCKSLMAYYQDGMIMLLQLVVHFPEPRVGKDLVALVVNLATHSRAAEVIVHSGLFPQVMLRVLNTRDPLLCKVIRHVSSHPEVLEPMFEMLQSDSVRMSKWMNEWMRLAISGVDNPDLIVEVMGTLANITLPDAPWGELCEGGLVDLLHRLLVPSFSEDDVVLECVMVIGNLALCKEAAHHIAGSRLPRMLQGLLIEKRDDEELVLQLLFAFHCLLRNDEVRDVVLQDTEISQCVMRFAKCRNPMVTEEAMKVLQVVADHVGEAVGQEGAPSWAEQIKAFRFEQSNAEWCQHVIRELNGGAGASPSVFYDNHPDSQGEEEEEFAFHWAGGDAADMQDLASRDWGNKDMDDFMHTSRYVS
eukprot:TRINITY_DN72151_c0_g1_i1.p1 TRINITY_DN72151_c0_g1~~TRINITY_DN72151_c0_g1_i1.p1  ORF type:complete len:796 (+),score=199.77 TRINITY_DN72151_c0_g1_i1:119-2506(+)